MKTEKGKSRNSWYDEKSSFHIIVGKVPERQYNFFIFVY